MSLKNSNSVKIIVSVLSAVAGYALVNFLGVHRFITLASGTAAGFACGLLPYYVHRHAVPRFAKVSLWICAVAGLLLGLILAVPVALIITAIGYLVAEKKKPAEPPPLATSATTDSPLPPSDAGQ